MLQLRAEPRDRPASDGPPGPELPTTPRLRRSPKWIAAGVAALCLGALASLFLYTQAADTSSVIAVREAVPRGSVIERSDVAVVALGSAPGVQTVAADRIDEVVGHRTAVDLPAGSLLPPAALADEPVPGPDRALVGIRLTDGRAPAGHLASGSPVRLVTVPPDGAAADYTDAYADLAVAATVIAVTPGSDGQSVVVDVEVAADDAATIARLAAQGRIVCLRDAER